MSSGVGPSSDAIQLQRTALTLILTEVLPHDNVVAKAESDQRKFTVHSMDSIHTIIIDYSAHKMSQSDVFEASHFVVKYTFALMEKTSSKMDKLMSEREMIVLRMADVARSHVASRPYLPRFDLLPSSAEIQALQDPRYTLSPGMLEIFQAHSEIPERQRPQDEGERRVSVPRGASNPLRELEKSERTRRQALLSILQG